jgi:hypothetical protein
MKVPAPPDASTGTELNASKPPSSTATAKRAKSGSTCVAHATAMGSIKKAAAERACPERILHIF